MDTVEVIETLAATQAGSARPSRQCCPTWRRARPRPTSGPPRDLFAHLRASDAILAPRVYQLLTRPGAPIAGYDERIWARVTGAPNCQS